MTDWKEYRLGDVVEILDSKRVPLSAMQRIKMQGEYRYFGAQSVIDYVNDYIFDGDFLILAEDGENLKSRKSPIAQLVSGKFWLNNHAHIMCSNGKADLKLLVAILNSIDISGYITGSAQPKLNQDNMSKIRINLPPLSAQRKIAGILSALDDKIETNRRINARLEELAQALFKSWFIDFTPFGGQMPEDWEECTLGDLTVECKDKVKTRTDVRVLSPVSSGELLLSDEYFTKQVYSKELSKYIIVRPDAFAYNPARINIGSIGRNDYDFYGCVSPVYVVFEAIDGYTEFINRFIKTKLFKNEVLLRAIGGVRQTLSFTDFALIQFIKPSLEIVQIFTESLKPLYQKMSTLNEESARLATLRDALLPKLMSGELKPE